MTTSKKKCAFCDKFDRTESMLKTNLGYVHDNDQCPIGLARDSRPQTVKARTRLAKQRKAEFRDSDTRHQKTLTQTAANRLCALLDEGATCISCGRDLRGGRFQHASHMKSRGANSFLRYSMLNLHLSCIPCNAHLSGNLEGYRKGLLERYGQPILDYLDSAPRSKEWTCEELIALRKEYNAEIRRLERGEPPSKNWRAI